MVYNKYTLKESEEISKKRKEFLESVTTYIYYGNNLINMLYWKLLLSIGIKRSTLPIPEGVYCYEPDIEKNNASKDWKVYYIKPCKYYKQISRNYAGCSFEGIITDDDVFNDQCKMCNENYGDEDYCDNNLKNN